MDNSFNKKSCMMIIKEQNMQVHEMHQIYHSVTNRPYFGNHKVCSAFFLGFSMDILYNWSINYINIQSCFWKHVLSLTLSFSQFQTAQYFLTSYKSVLWNSQPFEFIVQTMQTLKVMLVNAKSQLPLTFCTQLDAQEFHAFICIKTTPKLPSVLRVHPNSH